MEEKTGSAGYMSDFDEYLFGKGIHYEIYKKLGAHPGMKDGREGVYFAVWAPDAAAVSAAGDFNGWNPEADSLLKTREMGIFEGFIEGAEAGQAYLFCITTRKGRKIWKPDPFAFSSKLRPGTNSVICVEPDFPWTDDGWLEKRKNEDAEKRPVSIYEVHPGSWMRHPSMRENGTFFYNYRETAVRLAAYLKETGFTHVEFIGIAEHPLDASWGYQVTAYYAPTSRYGTPEDFRWMVNYLHGEGIGVLLDWVPAHFPRDEKGLADFDGSPVYEHADTRRGEQPDWGTKVFDYGKPQVSDFLIANALYWVEQFHIDGLRVDAVASMLYLDYGRKDGEWLPNIYGGNQNLEAIEFFRHLNSIMKKRNPGVLMMAEESTAWPGITADPKDGGLGFSFKWNMGWMHDFLEYIGKDPLFRKGCHNMMTFSLTYAWSEKYILPLSHDEVVHLKKSMLEKIPGTDEEKFACLKCAYGFMLGHPGKKLLFMGSEFGQRREWSEERELDFFLLGEEQHRQLKDFVGRLNDIYRTTGALYASDCDPKGFYWINADDAYRSIYSFVRRNPRTGQCVLFVVNFTPVARPDFQVGVPRKAKFTLLAASGLPKKAGEDDAHYLPEHTGEVLSSEAGECDRQPCHLNLPLCGYGFAALKFSERNLHR